MCHSNISTSLMTSIAHHLLLLGMPLKVGWHESQRIEFQRHHHSIPYQSCLRVVYPYKYETRATIHSTATCGAVCLLYRGVSEVWTCNPGLRAEQLSNRTQCTLPTAPKTSLFHHVLGPLTRLNIVNSVAGKPTQIKPWPNCVSPRKAVSSYRQNICICWNVF